MRAPAALSEATPAQLVYVAALILISIAQTRLQHSQ
jgi:hypothetical protein